jgi:(4S)-4-hydroxy-5-phosphonooxypentane-2,3-dione isomerase
MYTVLNILKVKPEHLQDFVRNVQDHARHSRQEPGCLRFDVLQDERDPNTICLYEVFRTEADLETHREQEYYKQWMAMSRDWRDPALSKRYVLALLLS